MTDQELSKYIDYDLSLINKKYDDLMFSKAKEMRYHMAKQMTMDIPALNLDSIEVNDGMLKSVLDRAPFEDTMKVLQFNILLARRLCNQIIKASHLKSVEKVAIYAFVIELGAREFILPENPEKAQSHLSAAKDRGFFFTPPSVAIRMVALSLKYNSKSESVFDPACGAGVFLAYSIIFNRNLKTVSGVELDSETALLATNLLKAICITENPGIMIEVECNDFFEYFKNNHSLQFDTVIMNPPYGSVKFLASDLTDASTKSGLSEYKQIELRERLRTETIEYAAQLRRQFAPYGIGKGTLEYSKLFMAALHELLSEDGFLVSITPSSWLGDESSKDFRRVIISSGYLYELWIIPELAKLFKGVNQPTSISVLGKRNSSVIVFSNPVLKIEDGETNSCCLDLQTVLTVAGNKVKFPKCNMDALKLLVKLQNRGKFSDIATLVNARGELDLTAFKQFVSKEKTDYRLIRGDHISDWNLKEADESDKAGYVLYDEFVESLGNSAKLQYIKHSRIAIPQCSYLQKKKRIEAAIVPSGSVVANSCNFISVLDDDIGIKQFYYWMVINSSVIEWEFRIFSYNNHVANSEIATLTCIPYDDLEEQIKQQLWRCFDASNSCNFYMFDACVATVLGLSMQEYEEVLASIGAENMNKYLKEFEKMKPTESIKIPLHIMPSLSKLDKLMIGYVEPGGNWTSIPDTVPSKRLDQIREMAKTRGMVRTTYYSRLRYNQPSYTISTYFNRPGNGANIHPWEDRTLSSREAARLQSFPDSFIFEGTDAAIRTQIGNAVPPLLGYAIGKAIIKKTGSNIRFCDMFAGAGGLSYGLELAGFKGMAAVELNKSAADTFAKNHSSDIQTIVGDINEQCVQKELVNTITAKNHDKEPWVLVGGPPCQGFSTAGYRNENDSRNKLVDTYLGLIKKLQPTIVVMENVPGILSMSKGQLIKSVYESLGQLGYHCTMQPWVLEAERYGVPQMRKRVIIVASKDLKYLPDYPEPIFSKCLGRREQSDKQLSLSLERYPITVGEAFTGLPPLMPINEYYPNDENIDHSYARWCQGDISTEEFLKHRGNL